MISLAPTETIVNNGAAELVRDLAMDVATFLRVLHQRKSFSWYVNECFVCPSVLTRVPACHRWMQPSMQ